MKPETTITSTREAGQTKPRENKDNSDLNDYKKITEQRVKATEAIFKSHTACI
jgi:hypothetical protein